MNSSTPPPGWNAAWTPSAQTACSFLLGAALTLILVHAVGSSRWSARPSELRESKGAIDLNRAERKDLVQIPGVGPSLADRILEHRQKKGRYASVNELRGVAGVGPGTLDHLKPYLVVLDGEDAETEMEPAPRKVREAGTKIDINLATASELTALPGIGPKIAQRIVDARMDKPFRMVEDLRRVPGIGQKTLEKLRPFVVVEEVRPRMD